MKYRTKQSECSSIFRLFIAPTILLLGACTTVEVQQSVARTEAPRIEYTNDASIPQKVVLGDGHELPILLWGDPETSSRVLLAVHGFVDRAAQFNRLASALEERNPDLLVVAYDQRSFGKSAHPAEPWPGGDVLVGDFRDVYTAISDRYPGRKIYVIGHSTGAAVIVLAFTAENEHGSSIGWPKVEPKGLILVAPAICSTANRGYLDAGVLAVIGTLFAETMVSTADSLKGQTDDETLVAEMLAIDSGFHKRVPLGKVLGATRLFTDAERQYLKLELPTLVLHGVKDDLFDARLVADQVRRFKEHRAPGTAPWLEAIYFDGRGHLLTSEHPPPKGDSIEDYPVYHAVHAFLSEGPDSPWINEHAQVLTALQAEKARWATSIARCTL